MLTDALRGGNGEEFGIRDTPGCGGRAVRDDDLSSGRFQALNDAAARRRPRAAQPLDKTTIVPEFDIAAWTLPADTTCGDFFDFRELPSGALAIMVADVSGHDIGASLVASQCQSALGPILDETEEPGRVLATINNLLLVESQIQGRFVTAFLGLLDHQEHQLRYVSAGHGPVWFYAKRSAEFHELDVQGYPLALEPDKPLSIPGVVSFAPGDLLVIVTDGFYEGTDAQDQCFGIERLQSHIRRQHERPAAQIIKSLHEALLTFTGDSPQRDDLTAVIIKRRSSPL